MVWEAREIDYQRLRLTITQSPRETGLDFVIEIRIETCLDQPRYSLGGFGLVPMKQA